MTEGTPGVKTPMPEGVKKVFSKEGIKNKQKEAMEAYEKKVLDLRQIYARVVATEDGIKIFTHIFHLCGGGTDLVSRDKTSNKFLTEDTILRIGANAVYQVLRYNLSSDVLAKVERAEWERE